MPNRTIDRTLSGTGVRDSIAGGYIEARTLGLSGGLVARIDSWVKRYEQAHYIQFSDKAENEKLNQEGVEISRLLQGEHPDTKIEYYSNAEMHKIVI